MELLLDEYQMGIICPICKKPGYIVKEKPRKKHETLTLRGWKKSGLSWQEYSKGYELSRFRNDYHKDYSSMRTRSELFRIKHNYQVTVRYRKNGQLHGRRVWKTRFCYIGAPHAILKKLEISTRKLHDHIFYHKIEKWPNRLLKQLESISYKDGVLSEQYVRFLARLKFIADHPNTLKKSVGMWLENQKQKREKSITNKAQQVLM